MCAHSHTNRFPHVHRVCEILRWLFPLSPTRPPPASGVSPSSGTCVRAVCRPFAGLTASSSCLTCTRRPAVSARQPDTQTDRHTQTHRHTDKNINTNLSKLENVGALSVKLIAVTTRSCRLVMVTLLLNETVTLIEPKRNTPC